MHDDDDAVDQLAGTTIKVNSIASDNSRDIDKCKRKKSTQNDN